MNSLQLESWVDFIGFSIDEKQSLKRLQRFKRYGT